MNVSFNPLAKQELNDAARYYELESPGLGAAFMMEVQRPVEPQGVADQHLESSVDGDGRTQSGAFTPISGKVAAVCASQAASTLQASSKNAVSSGNAGSDSSSITRPRFV